MSADPTLAQEIEEAANGEPIEAIVVGLRRDGDPPWRDDPQPEEGDFPTPDVVLTWDEARPHLDYTYDAGFGGQDCHSLYAWTASRVLFVAEYDGSTRVTWVHRNPTATTPRSV